MDADIKEMFKLVLDSQLSTDQAIRELTQTVTQSVDASDARVKRLEDNLDGLIRAIAREHSNGKG